MQESGDQMTDAFLSWGGDRAYPRLPNAADIGHMDLGATFRENEVASEPFARPPMQDQEIVKAGGRPRTVAQPVPGDDGRGHATGSTTPPASDAMEDDDDGFSTDDPQNVAEYASDIYSNLGRDEVNYLPRPDYMELQKDVNAKMRAILIDWLVEVHLKYKLKTETLFLTVNLIDRFLEKRQLTRKKLQLVGVTSMLISAKFEEIYPPEVRDFVYITDNAYTKEDILKMEVTMLTALKFVLGCPTVAHFLQRYQRVNRCAEEHCHLMQYVLELTLPDLKMIRYTPSHLAAAAALLSNKLLRLHPCWPSAMVRHTRHTEPMVKVCAREMCTLLEQAEKNPLQAVRKKFSQPRYSGVAKICFSNVLQRVAVPDRRYPIPAGAHGGA
jgi:cyclin B